MIAINNLAKIRLFIRALLLLCFTQMYSALYEDA